MLRALFRFNLYLPNPTFGRLAVDLILFVQIYLNCIDFSRIALPKNGKMCIRLFQIRPDRIDRSRLTTRGDMRQVVILCDPLHMRYLVLFRVFQRNMSFGKVNQWDRVWLKVIMYIYTWPRHHELRSCEETVFLWPQIVQIRHDFMIGDVISATPTSYLLILWDIYSFVDISINSDHMIN